MGTLELRITSVFSCVARGFKPRASFRFTGYCWWRLLAVDGGSGTSGGHAWSTPVMRRPGLAVAAVVGQGWPHVAVAGDWVLDGTGGAVGWPSPGHCSTVAAR